VPTSAEELGAIVARLEDAAARLKERATGPAPSRAERPAPAPRRRLGEVLDGLERANVEVRRARERLAEIEARLAAR
jgi:exonuclease VII small subunit